jgi:hypothetical protein
MEAAPALPKVPFVVTDSGSGWETFQRRFVADAYDSLCVLRSIREEDGGFRVPDRAGDKYPKGRSPDRVLHAVANPAGTSWTVRAEAMRPDPIVYVCGDRGVRSERVIPDRPARESVRRCHAKHLKAK